MMTSTTGNVIGKLSLIPRPASTTTAIVREADPPTAPFSTAILVMLIHGSSTTQAAGGLAARQAEAGQVGGYERLEAHRAPADDAEIDLDNAPDAEDGFGVRDVGGGAD